MSNVKNHPGMAMKKSLTSVLSLVFAFAARILSAQSAGHFNIIEENDVFFNTDRHYTQGLSLSYVTSSLNDRGWLDAPFQFLRDDAWLFSTPASKTDDRLEWVFLAQSIFTPSITSSVDPSPKDHPYAGWLYNGLTFIQNSDDRRLDTFTLQLGVVGSDALGRQAQNDFHQFIAAATAKGWDYQLKNEIGAVAGWERKWRYELGFANGFSTELLPEIGLTVGNVFTYGEIGGLWRMGRNLKANWGPALIRPSNSGTGYFAPERTDNGLGFDLFVGGQGRAIARNIFLDGNTFANSRSVDKEYVVADLMAGVEFFASNYFRVGGTVVLRTPEYQGQQGIDRFGSINFEFQF
jgi:lipid A 3-O-deacylase